MRSDEQVAADTRNGILRASDRVLRLHPTWTDEQIARALGLRRDELYLVAEARRALEGNGELS
jgi:hypothetical protein